MINQEIKERMTRTKIQLQTSKPFFAYLLLNLEYIESDEVPTMAIDNYNHLYYNAGWIKGLSDKNIEGTICHEVLHIVFSHLIRTKTRDVMLFNVSSDICVNNILVANDFDLPKGGLIPSNNEITFCGIDVKEIDRKSAENIYDEIYSKVKKTQKNIKEMEDGRFDEHITDDLKDAKDSKGNPLSEKQIKEIKGNADKWKKLLIESATYAKIIGKMPNGIDRQIGELLNEKIDWRQALYVYITNTLPIDFSYSRPSKRSLASGFYMPYMKKEELEVVISLDTSGSIDSNEFREFVAEMVGVKKSFSNIKMTVIICDCEIKDVIEVSNGGILKLESLEVKGGGGTSHKPVIDLIDREYPNTKIYIALTDGYTDYVDVSNKMYKTMWVLCSGGSSDIVEKSGGQIIRLS